VSDQRREANVLGALALVLADQINAAIAGSTDLSASAAAALSALHQFLDRPTVDRLSEVLGLTHSGTVRLVDRLEEAGFVSRAGGADARSRTLVLTRRGKVEAKRITAARLSVLEAAFTGLPSAERQALLAGLGRMMANVVANKDGGAWVCRLCDLNACGRPEGVCPAANAAADKHRV
jgi:DNA-binding MarR family transcriptional regulator